MKFNNKTFLVTGGAGFIGSHIVDRALELGAESVTVFDNFRSGSLDNLSHLENNDQVKIINGDVRNLALLQSAVEGTDIIINEAAAKMVDSIEDPRTDLETNIIGPFNVIQAALKHDARIVHASTGSVFGSSDKPMPETHAQNPTSPYGISKLAGEKYMLYYAQEFGLKTSVLRYFHVFGPRQDFSGEAGVVSIFLNKVLNNQAPTIFSGGEQIRCFTYISDDVDATLLLAHEKSAIGQDYNVASKERISINQLAKTIIGKYGSPSISPIMGKFRKGENAKPIPDTRKIESLGWRAKVPFEEGLELTKKWVAGTRHG